MAQRNPGDVIAYAAPINVVSASVTTSGGVAILSVDTSGSRDFGLVNRGSTSVYIQASFDGTFFKGNVAVKNVVTATTGLLIDTVPASSQVAFEGIYKVVRVYASGSGVYQVELSYR